MLKCKMYIISIVGMCCLLVGCGNSNTDNITIGQNDSEIQDSISYNGYSGSFELIRAKEDITENDTADYSNYNSSWTEKEMINAVNERS